MPTSPPRVTAAGGRVVMTRADHPSGTDRIAEALARTDPDRRHDVVVNLQGDLPTVAPHVPRQAAAVLADPEIAIGTPVAPIARAEGSGCAERGEDGRHPGRARPVPRALFHPRPRALGEGICTTISASMPGAGRRWSASLPCPRHRWNGARSWSSCAHWKPACASMPCWWTTCRSASTRKRTSKRARQLLAP